MSELSIDAPHALLTLELQRLREAFLHDPFPDLSQRQRWLSALEQGIRDHSAALSAAVADDYGHRSAHETQLLELFPALQAVQHARRRVGAWMRPRRRGVGPFFWPLQAQVLPQPLGVVGIVVPWNYPIYLSLAPLVGALAAGNRVMIKVSETTPQTGAALRQLFNDVLPGAVVRVVEGDSDVAKAFVALPFDHLLFTGGSGIGRSVMAAASQHLTPVTLELGGKSPAILGEDARFDEAVERILMAKLFNAGQTCVAPDYVLLPKGSEERFVDSARRVVAQHYPHLASNPDYSAIVSAGHYRRLQDWLAEAQGQRAIVIPLADVAPGEHRKLAPLLIQDAPADCRLMTEEIFGPFLPLVSYQTLDEAIAYVNARPRPLSLYYFGHRATDIQRVVKGTVSGGVAINETLLQAGVDRIPFGGVGASGMGRYHGQEGFETFSHLKSVVRQRQPNGVAMLYPPFGPRAERLLRWLLG